MKNSYDVEKKYIEKTDGSHVAAKVWFVARGLLDQGRPVSRLARSGFSYKCCLCTRPTSSVCALGHGTGTVHTSDFTPHYNDCTLQTLSTLPLLILAAGANADYEPPYGERLQPKPFR